MRRSGIRARKADAVLETPPTIDRLQIDDALERVLHAGSLGDTRFSPAMRTAIEAFPVVTAPSGQTVRIVLFMSESPTPVINESRTVKYAEPEMKDAALQAIDAGVVFHTFGLGSALEKRPPHALSNIAGATGGAYTAVSDISRLHCDLAAALLE